MRVLLLILCISFSTVSCQNKQTTVADKKKADIVVPASRLIPISLIEQKLIDMGMTCINDADSSILIDIKYATTDNFTKTVLYDSLSKAYLHPIAAEKLIKAQRLLKEINPNYTLIVYDAARPHSVQKKMYNKVKDTKYKAYVAHPTRTSLHNYGIAVDLSICDLQGKVLDMGTPFDFFGKEAAIRNEAAYLTKKQIENRKLLRKVMTDAGFLTILGEWWHFNAMPLTEAKAKCKLLE